MSRKDRWWKSDNGPAGCLRSADGYVFPKKGLWHAVVFVPSGKRLLSDHRRAREAQMAVEDAAEKLRRGQDLTPKRRVLWAPKRK